MMECPDCGNEMEITEAPIPIFSIPFTKLEVWRWGKQSYCLTCVTEYERLYTEQIYDAGIEEGYERCLRD